MAGLNAWMRSSSGDRAARVCPNGRLIARPTKFVVDISALGGINFKIV